MSMVSVTEEASVLDTRLEAAISPDDDLQLNSRPPRQRRWTFRLRRRGGGGGGSGDPGLPDSAVKFKGISFSCRCKSAVRGSCLILISSFAELLGCLIALLYGIAYIQSACNFYELDSDPEKREKEYDEKLERVLFLGENRVGFVGLLATCIIGLIVSLLMPIGTIYKSWKCLRAAMTLLFSICFVHIILAFVFLPCNELMASLVAIPFRICEFLLIFSYIKYYKQKKLEELKERIKAGGAIITTSVTAMALGQSLLDNSSLCSFDKDDLLELAGLPKPDSVRPNGNDAQPYLDTMMVLEAGQPGDQNAAASITEINAGGHKRRHHKRKLQNQAKKEERVHRISPKYDSYMQYDMPK